MFAPKINARFLTNDAIVRRLGPAKAKAMNRAGAAQRGIMKRMVRFRKNKVSSPGSPPFAHVSSSEFGLRKIFYVYDARTEETVVGPIAGRNGGVPGELDQGATVIRRGKDGKLRSQKIRARPFRQQSFEKFKRSYPEHWKNVLNG